MRLNAIAGGVIAGAIGAAVWAVIARVTGMEIGWIAWGVGLLVGLGVVMGNKGEGSPVVGVAAAVIAALAVVAGKYTMVQLVLPDADEIVAQALHDLDNDELVVSYLADEVVAEFEAEGKPVDWPEDIVVATASAETDYPADVWAEAVIRWEAKSADEREAYRAQLKGTVAANADVFRSTIAAAGFTHTFGLMDIVFFGLAVLTAFKIGRSGSLKESEA